MRRQLSGELAAGQRGNRDADRRIGLVDLADRGHARLDLLTATAVDQPGAAAVAGAGVDLVELDHSVALEDAPATTRIRMTMTIAIAWNRTRLRIQFCCCSPVTSLPDAMAITPRTRT